MFEIKNEKNFYEYLPYITQRFRIETGSHVLQIFIINNSRPPRGHCRHDRYLVWFPFFHHILLKKQIEVNLIWKPLEWNYSELILPKDSGFLVLGLPGVLGPCTWYHLSTMPKFMDNHMVIGWIIIVEIYIKHFIFKVCKTSSHQLWILCILSDHPSLLSTLSTLNGTYLYGWKGNSRDLLFCNILTKFVLQICFFLCQLT